ncbi:MAG: hypothetical protein ACE366_26095 [Bradymonadia bacterium]
MKPDTTTQRAHPLLDEGTVLRLYTLAQRFKGLGAQGGLTPEDLVHEALGAMLAGKKTLEYRSEATFMAWARVVLYRIAIDGKRKRSLERALNHSSNGSADASEEIYAPHIHRARACPSSDLVDFAYEIDDNAKSWGLEFEDLVMLIRHTLDTPLELAGQVDQFMEFLLVCAAEAKSPALMVAGLLKRVIEKCVADAKQGTRRANRRAYLKLILDNPESFASVLSQRSYVSFIPVLFAHYAQGKSFKDASGELGCSYSNARNKHSDLLKALKGQVFGLVTQDIAWAA